MTLLLTILIDGLTYASWLFIVALGLTLVFGILKILNVAHGSFYALGAYAAASLVGWFASMELAPELSIVAMLLAAVAVAALVAPLCERGLLRVFYGRDEVLLVLVTFALLSEALFQARDKVLVPFGVLPMFMLIFLTGFEVLVAFLQAYIFTILTAVYIGGAVHPEH